MSCTRIKFLVFFFLAFSVSTFISAQALNGAKWADVQNAKSGSISLTYIETPGFSYKDAGGNLTGICIDIMNDFIKYVERTKSVKLTPKYFRKGNNFVSFYETVKTSSGGVIGVSNVTITEARKREIKFSPPFINSFAMLVTHSSVPTLTDIKQLGTSFKGMKAYVVKGTTNEKRLMDLKKKYYPEMEIVTTISSPEALEKTIADKSSFTELDFIYYVDAIKNKQPIKKHTISENSYEEFGFIMPLDSDWAPVLQEFFVANGGYRKSSDYKKTIAKHLGTTGAKLLESATQ